ncbi:MAG: hypothetical protein KC425_21560 [Anaerolineales bacterium]|nr:hypothetical protein [Anaerolineales bacterium]
MRKSACSEPTRIDETDLLAYLAGEADADVRRHVETCTACQARAAALQAADMTLWQTAVRLDCPDLDTLLRIEAGLMPAAAWQPHIAACPHCQEVLQALAAAVTDTAVSPATQDTWSEKLHDGLRTAGRRLLEALPRPVPRAQLAFRGDETREWLYEVEAFQIVITVAEAVRGAGAWQITGQVLEAGVPVSDSLAVQLREQARVVAACSAEAFGLFELSDIPAGTYRLELEMAAAQLIVSDLIVP